MLSALPDRADRMDDVTRRQPVAARDPRFSGGTAAERPAFGQKLRPGRAVNRAIDAAATEQRRVGRVDDRVDIERRDIDVARFDDSAAEGRHPALREWADDSVKWLHGNANFRQQ